MQTVMMCLLLAMSLAEAFRFGYLLGKRKKSATKFTVSEKDKKAAEKAEKELYNMLTYDGSEQ